MLERASSISHPCFLNSELTLKSLVYCATSDALSSSSSPTSYSRPQNLFPMYLDFDAPCSKLRLNARLFFFELIFYILQLLLCHTIDITRLQNLYPLAPVVNVEGCENLSSLLHPPLTVQFLIQTSADGFGLNVSVRLGESRSVMWEPGRVKIRDIDATRLPKPEQLKIPHYHPCG